MEAIKCEKLTFSYPKSEYPAIKDVDFSVEQGEMCLVIGKSAGGKSTLLKLLKKELAPVGNVQGTVKINGTVGFVSQNVEENIVTDRVRSELSFGLSNAGYKRNQIELLIAETATYFNLEKKLDCSISTLSGGEKQIVNLASVMITKPDILVLDEPVSQLDPVSAEQFISVIKKLHKDFSTTIVIAEHNIDNLYEYADSVALIESARLVLKSSGAQMIDYLKNNQNPMIQEIPTCLTLFDGAKTVKQCRDELCKKNIKSLPTDSEALKTAIKIKGFYFAYNKGNDILSDLSLKIYKGKINAILGKNSSGKSTLLKSIVGIEKGYRGKIKTDGKVSMLCQNVFDLFTKEKCADEVEFDKITQFLEIDDIKNKHPYDLSGGQAQRLALAKVLNTNADIILLDEPTKNLDADLKIKLADILNQLCAMGKTILLVSHDIEFVGRYAQYVSFLSDGTIVSTAPRKEFFSSLSFYTTSVAKITKGIADNIVSVDDLKLAGGLYENC